MTGWSSILRTILAQQEHWQSLGALNYLQLATPAGGEWGDGDDEEEEGEEEAEGEEGEALAEQVEGEGADDGDEEQEEELQEAELQEAMGEHSSSSSRLRARW